MILRLLLRALGVGCLLLALGLAVQQARFLSKAERAEGTVERVEARDDRCRRKRAGQHGTGSRHDCTRYTAHVRFAHPGGEQEVAIPAGKHKGHGQPTTHAELQSGERLPLLYEPGRPQDAVRGDSLLQLWGGPLLAVVFGVVLLLVSTARRRGG
jgi:hypothetical protein